MRSDEQRGAQLMRAAVRGALAGAVGVAVMTAGEKLEQAITHRPNSYVPARTLITLLGGTPSERAEPVLWNHAMHWSTGLLLGALRGVWAATGIRGPRAGAMHAVVRLAFDQTLENATGAGAPPPTWPRRELAVDVAHKLAYSLATGFVADRMVRPGLESRRGAVSH